MITKEQAREIYNYYSQIETAEKLIADLNQALAEHKDRLRDGILRDKEYSFSGSIQIQVPYFDNLTGDFKRDSGARIYNINYPCALKVLKAHVRILKSELKALQNSCNT